MRADGRTDHDVANSHLSEICERALKSKLQSSRYRNVCAHRLAVGIRGTTAVDFNGMRDRLSRFNEIRSRCYTGYQPSL